MKDTGTSGDVQGDYGAKGKRRSGDEIVRLGKEIYEREIRGHVEPEHVGEIVAIDVDSGRWGLGADEREAAGRLRVERPEAVNVLLHRAGYRALRSFGAGFSRRSD